VPVYEKEQGKGQDHIKKDESEFADVLCGAISQLWRREEEIDQGDHHPEAENREGLKKGPSPKEIEEKKIQKDTDDLHGRWQLRCGHAQEFKESDP